MAERQTIDTEIGEYSRAILAPEARWNALAPVSNLPPEIICRIFHFVKSADYGRRLRWIKVTHVCADWRNLALNSATLWSTPPTTNPQWLDVMLKRSKMAGLTIEIDFGEETRLSHPLAVFGQIIQEHGSRIQHLKLMDVTKKLAPLFDRLTESAPQLETLSLTSTAKSFFAGVMMGNHAVVHIPEGAFTSAQNLRSIELAGINTRWDLCNLCNLTQLKLHDLPASTSVMLEPFLALLRAMPKLEYLDLKEVPFPTTGSIQEGDCGIVDLPHLQTLILYFSRPDTILAFLSCLIVPPHTTMVLTLTLKHEQRTYFSGIISQISKIYSHGTSRGQDFRALDTLKHQPACLGINLYSQISMLGRYMDAELSLRIFLDHDALQDSDYILSQIFTNSLPLDKISHASLDYRLLDTVSESLKQTIGSLPALSSTTVTGQYPLRHPQDTRHPFVEALLPSSETLDADGRPIYFRNLISIDMDGLVFQTPESIEPGPNVDLGELLHCLVQRRKCGAKIERLKLNRCYGVKRNIINELRNVVADVEWME